MSWKWVWALARNSFSCGLYSVLLTCTFVNIFFSCKIENCVSWAFQEIDLEENLFHLDHETGVHILLVDTACRCFDFGYCHFGRFFKKCPSMVQPPQMTWKGSQEFWLFWSSTQQNTLFRRRQSEFWAASQFSQFCFLEYENHNNDSFYFEAALCLYPEHLEGGTDNSLPPVQYIQTMK